MEFLIGVLSSVLASAFIALAAYFYPTALRVTGRGVRDISGSWTYYQFSPNGRHRPSGEVTVRQWGTRIWMNFSVMRRLDGTQYADATVHQFKVRARWRSDQLVGTFIEPHVRHRRGVLVLHWRSSVLVGKSMYVESNPAQVSVQTADANWVTVHDVRLSRLGTRQGR